MKKIYLSLMLLAIVAISHSQSNKEEQAIKALLEKESATWRAKDVVGHAACWQIRPYSRILVSTGNGEVIDVPPMAMVHGGVAITDCKLLDVFTPVREDYLQKSLAAAAKK